MPLVLTFNSLPTRPDSRENFPPFSTPRSAIMSKHNLEGEKAYLVQRYGLSGKIFTSSTDAYLFDIIQVFNGRLLRQLLCTSCPHLGDANSLSEAWPDTS